MSARNGGALFSSVWLFRLRGLWRRLWARAGLFCLLAVVTALLAVFLGPYVPEDIAVRIGGDAVDTVLQVMATSMLAVTTFSLSTMVAAQTAATEASSPRASVLLTEDRHAQNALSAFIGAFIFSVVGLVALSTGIYGPQGRVIMFAVTMVVLAAVVATLIRWIDALSRLGGIRQTIERVEEAARLSLTSRAREPLLGGRAYEDAPHDAKPVHASETGYVQHLDIDALAKCAEKHRAILYLEAEPGTFVHTQQPLLRYQGKLDEDCESELAACFVIGGYRTFEQDMRFGLIVLSEIAQRALSPALNDPGTALDVISVQLRLLAVWQKIRDEGSPEPRHDRLFVRSPKADDLVGDAFAAIARDGASNVAVARRLQKSFGALAEFGDKELAQAAHLHAELACERALKALDLAGDRKSVMDAARAAGARRSRQN